MSILDQHPLPWKMVWSCGGWRRDANDKAFLLKIEDCEPLAAELVAAIAENKHLKNGLNDLVAELVIANRSCLEAIAAAKIIRDENARLREALTKVCHEGHVVSRAIAITALQESRDAH